MQECPNCQRRDPGYVNEPSPIDIVIFNAKRHSPAHNSVTQPPAAQPTKPPVHVLTPYRAFLPLDRTTAMLVVRPHPGQPLVGVPYPPEPSADCALGPWVHLDHVPALREGAVLRVGPGQVLVTRDVAVGGLAAPAAGDSLAQLGLLTVSSRGLSFLEDVRDSSAAEQF